MKMTISPIPSAKYVANALVLYVYVGDYSLPLPMITWFGWGDIWGPRGRLRVEMNNLKREVLCSYMICEVKIML